MAGVRRMAGQLRAGCLRDRVRGRRSARPVVWPEEMALQADPSDQAGRRSPAEMSVSTSASIPQSPGARNNQFPGLSPTANPNYRPAERLPAAGPVPRLPAVEVHAGIDECQTSTDRVRVALPEDDSLVRPGDPSPVGRVDVDRRVECMRPLDHAAVEMRVADCDCIDAAERVYGRDHLVVDVGDHVPDDVPGWRSDQQGALTDRRRRAGADAGDPGAFLLEPAPVAGAGEFSQAGPLLPVPPDVLALVQADRAVVTRRSALNTAGYADGEVSSHPSRYTPAPVHGIDPQHMTS